MKAKKINKLLLISIFFILLLSVALHYGVFVDRGNLLYANAFENESIDTVKLVLDKLFDQNIKSAQYLYSLDESSDFILLELEDGSATILYKETMELLEVIDDGNIIKNVDGKKVYYAGPSNYFEKIDEGYINVTNGEIKVYDISYKQEISSRIRNTFSGKTTMNLEDGVDDFMQSYAANVPKFEKLIEFRDYVGNYINNYTFFASNPHHGKNVHNTCASVAVQLLLEYHNYYSDRRIIKNDYLFIYRRR